MARRKSRILSSLLLLSVGIAAGWWIARHGLPLLQTAVAPSPAPAAGDIRRVDFRNFTYPALCAEENGLGGGIPVRDGEYAKEDEFGRLYFSIISVSYGDLTGDTAPEAAVTAICNTGGTGQFSEGMVFSMQEGKPVLIDRIEGGDRAYGGIVAITVEDRRLVVERYATDEGGPSCCPRYIDTTWLGWDGTRLVQEEDTSRRPAPGD